MLPFGLRTTARPADREPGSIVTPAHRARLVVALGLVNLALAGVALAVGAFGLPLGPPSSPRPTEVAVISPTPEPSVPESPPPTPTPTPQTQPPPEPSELPTPTPSPTPTPPEETLPPIAVAPTASPAPRPAATQAPARATPRPTPAPAAPPAAPPAVAPTPAPPAVAPTPAPPAAPTVDAKALPPCPERGDPPPGQAKVVGPKEHPCRPGAGVGRGDDDPASGVFLVVPVWVAAAFRLRGRRPER